MFDDSVHVARMLDDVLDCVVAVRGKVADDACVQFSDRFYQCVIDGRSYRTAVDAGRTIASASGDAFVVFGRRLDAVAVVKGGADRDDAS